MKKNIDPNKYELVMKIYQQLLSFYGPQGWWPIFNHKGSNPTKTGSVKGYHISDYSFPHNNDEKFEICLGCFLTQNTNWQSVEKSISKLNSINALSINGIKKLSDGKFKEMIKPSGYYNQKANYIKKFIPFFESLKERTPSRDELLSLNGIGPETADSMLLYAFKQPEFVVDTYTKRIFATLGLISWNEKYELIKSFIENSILINYNTQSVLEIYQEFHALIVEHAKRFYSKKPYGENCFLLLNLK
jgi:endonuclease-3 related protein